MPELPEVEVVKRSLMNKTQNLIVKAVKINDGRLRYRIDRNKIKKIIGLRLKKISRRSKYLLFFFNKDIVMLVHLGMTGKFFFIDQKRAKYRTSFYYNINKDKDNKHDHIIFNLSNNQKLIYNDVRKFGFIKLISPNQRNTNNHLQNLGPEPLNSEFNHIYLNKKIRNIKKNTKSLLMDQKIVSGLGNIYVNEILNLSSVNPKKISKNLSPLETKKIIRNTKITLKKAISLGGSSIRDFKGVYGNNGNFQQNFMVYNRSDQMCKKPGCRGLIKKIYISNRSTFYCLKCQK